MVGTAEATKGLWARLVCGGGDGGTGEGGEETGVEEGLMPGDKRLMR
jgi:hypothetical protein